MQNSPYPIGTPGVKWTAADKLTWYQQQQIQRSYQQQVVAPLQQLANQYQLTQYGALSEDPQRYPLYLLQGQQHPQQPYVLITGGVHGYETSGVQGALAFCQQKLAHYQQHFNLIIAPCISPWGYETINRWNPAAIDPNRSFTANSPAEESAALYQRLAQMGHSFLAHIDLHETTDSDNSEFRPALEARDAIEQKTWNIPDGFYLVDDSQQPQAEFQQAIIQAVAKVTHIAQADEQQQLIGNPLQQFGVIEYDTKGLGLCAGVTDAKYVTTTEVYPDSARTNSDNCIEAQVAAICGGLDYLLATVIR